MKIIFDRSFSKSIDRLKDETIKTRLEKIIKKLEIAESFNDVSNIKQLKGYKNYYRIRAGSYRIGFELENSTTIRLIVVGHRKDIYKGFP